MISLIVFAIMASTLCGIVFWLAHDRNKYYRERREAPRKRQQARQAELRHKLKMGREASKPTAS
ncbi:MAG: hypothetical protein ACOYBR_03030 [Fluviibacter sp.]